VHFPRFALPFQAFQFTHLPDIERQKAEEDDENLDQTGIVSDHAGDIPPGFDAFSASSRLPIIRSCS
jgi:hypothetical protein